MSRIVMKKLIGALASGKESLKCSCVKLPPGDLPGSYTCDHSQKVPAIHTRKRFIGIGLRACRPVTEMP